MGRTSGQTVSTYGSGSLSETAPGSGVWRYRYRLEGKQCRATFGSKSAPLTRKQAERRVRGFEVPAPVAAAPVGGLTFAELLEEWLRYGQSARGQQWAPRTADENRHQVETRITPALGQIRLSDLSARDLERAYESWRAEGLSASTIHRFSSLIGSALSFAVRRDYLDSSPARKAVAPAQTKSPTKVPTTEQVAALLRAAEIVGQDMPTAVALAALTGARAGEVAALRWEDIDLRQGLVRIDKSVTEVGGKVTIKGTKTGDEHVAHVQGRNLVVLQSVLTPGPADTYVIDGGTEPVNPGVISDRFVSVRGVAHVRGVSFRSLRSYWATTLLSAGVPVLDVAAAGGWKSTRMVLDVYGRSTRSGLDQVGAVELLPTVVQDHV